MNPTHFLSIPCTAVNCKAPSSFGFGKAQPSYDVFAFGTCKADNLSTSNSPPPIFPTLRFSPLSDLEHPSATPIFAAPPTIMFDNIDFTQPSLWGKLPHAPVAAMTLAD
jgi:hypothetical protein